MFWGLVLKANKRYSQIVSKSFHLSQAALDISCSSEDPVQVMLTSDKFNYILCTLRKAKVEQVPLDLNFAEGDEIALTIQGSSNVHLTGYLILSPDSMLGETDERENGLEQKSRKRTGNIDLKNRGGDSDFNYIYEGDSENKKQKCESYSEEEPKLKEGKIEKKFMQNGVNGKFGNLMLRKNKINASLKAKKSKDCENFLQGGVRIEEIRVGNGAEAKPGKKLQVYYEGRLKSNDKIFDSSKQGTGFKFQLGRGDVIAGWDFGLVGMKVGGKRRITCPPKFAYGAKGSPPIIPPNSTLLFDVELKSVH